MTKLLGGYELPPVVYGILLKVCATLAFMLMATVAKFLADDIPVGETVFFRAFFAFIPIAIVMLQSRADLWSLSTSRPWAHARRSLSGVLAMFTYFAALSMLPLAELTAIGFTSPLIVVVLSPFILGERVGIFRRVTALIGFVGVVIMILPALSTPTGSGTEFLGIGVAFLNAFLVAMTMMFIRMMADSEPSLTIAFYFQLTCTLVSALTLPFAWVTPDLEQFGLLVALERDEIRLMHSLR